MPNESLNVYLTAVDRMSPVLASITDKTKALDKESQELQQTFDALQKANKGLIERKTELQKKLQEVNEEVKEARKSFKDLGDEASSDAYEKAQEKQQKLKNEIAATTKALQENQKIYRENIETIRKGGLEQQGTGSSGLSAIWGGLGIGQQLSALAEQASTSLLQSALGDGAGSIASGAIFNAITGASLGTAIAPGIGTAIGAALGGVLGAVSSSMEELGDKDDAFKAYYGGLYDDVKGRSGEMVEAGSTLASGRDTNRISFKTLFGDEDTANKYLEDLIDMANTTPFLYDDLVSMSKTLATYGYSAKKGSKDYILDTLQTIGDTGAALGMGTGDMTAVAQALGRMKSSDKATLEYLNILNDRGIGAVGMLAEAKGVSVGDMYGMISKGGISGTEAVDIITAALKDAYSGSMEEQSKTFSGLSSTLEGLRQNVEAQGGEGYNTLRQEGIQAEVNALGGDLGDAIGEINAIMGENQARRENLQDQYMREVLGAVLRGEQGELWEKFDESQRETLTEMAQQYAELKEQYEASERTDWEAGAQMEKLYEVAQTMGQSYFEDSAEIARLNDIELEEIQAIRESCGGLLEATQNIYRQTQELSKGRASIYVPLEHAAGVEMLGDGTFVSYGEDGGVELLSSNPYAEQGIVLPDGTVVPAGLVNSHAFGLARVPYDGYPALLHADERVLTANQARAQDAGQGSPIQITITGNSFSGLPEEMADQLAEIIVRRLEQAAVAAAPK